MAAGKRKTKETSTSGRGKRAKTISSDESADDGIDEGREESENILRQSASKKKETKWHVEMKEQIDRGRSELLEQLQAKKEKITPQKNRRNQEIRALVKSINPSLFQQQTPASRPRESDANIEHVKRAQAEVITKHKASDEHVRFLTEHSSVLLEIADKLKQRYASTSTLIAKTKFPDSITGQIQDDRRKLLAVLQDGRRVAEADITTLTTGTPSLEVGDKKRRVNGKIMDEIVEVLEDREMSKWRRIQACSRAETEDEMDNKENRIGASATRGQVEGKSLNGMLGDACRGVEKMVRGLPEME